MPFDRPDDDAVRKLPAALHALYPGLGADLTYADVFERKCYIYIHICIDRSNLSLEPAEAQGRSSLGA